MKFAALLPRAMRQFSREPLYAVGTAGTLALAVASAVASFAVVKPSSPSFAISGRPHAGHTPHGRRW